MEKGDLSKKDALQVGVIIEETDLDDLNSALALTSHTDITNVYTNLRQGSYNHLSAFNSQLSKYLSPPLFRDRPTHARPRRLPP